MRTALIIVDVQNDFLPGGALAVPNGDEVIEPIKKLAGNKTTSFYNLIALTRDWHPDNHCSFSGTPRYEDKSWPKHCVQGSEGARISRALWYLFSDPRTELITKGTNSSVEAYSGFDGKDVWGEKYLNALLVEKAIGAVDVVGLALDYCVKATAIDARRHGFKTRVILDATRPVAPKTGYLSVAEMSQEGVDFV